MTFSLKKTLSRMHPRRRSTNSVHLELPSTPPLSSPPSPAEQEPSFTRHAQGDSSSSSPETPHNSSGATDTLPDNRIAVLNARIAALDADNSELQAKIVALTLEIQIQEEEVSKFRCGYYEELSEAIIRRREAAAAEDRYRVQDQKVARMEQFISSIVEVGLHDPVLSEAWQNVKAGQPSDDALVDSIKKAASKTNTSWARIIPAITGPRTPEHYLSAINLTLKTRHELKKTSRIAKFWKTVAKKDPAHCNTVTPSSSALSDLSMRNVPETEERHTAVDDLLARLKSGDPPICTRIKDTTAGVPKTLPHTPPKTVCVSALGSRGHVPTLVSDPSNKLKSEDPPICTGLNDLDAGVLETLSLTPTRTVGVSSGSRGGVPASVSVSSNKSTPTPTASSQDMLSSDDVQGISQHRLPYPAAVIGLSLITSTGWGLDLTAPTEHYRPVLRSVDLNYDSTIRTAPIEASGRWIRQQSTRALEKREAFIVTGPVLPVEEDVQSEEFAAGTPASGFSQPTSQPLQGDDMLATKKALLSLERICAGFSSGSLGSLGTTTEGSSNHLQTFGSTFNPESHSSLVSYASLATSSKLSITTTMSPARPSIPVSSLPVLKHRQLERSQLERPSCVPSIKKIHDRGIPAATYDSLDDLKSRSLHTILMEGSSCVAPDDVPSPTNKLISDSVTPSKYKQATLVNYRGPPSNIRIPYLSRPALAPLASHVLKCEVAERSYGQPSRHPQFVPGKTQTDTGNVVSRVVADKENRKSPAKTLRKRKGMLFTERVQSVSSNTLNANDLYTTSGFPPNMDHKTRASVQRPVVDAISADFLCPASMPQVQPSRRRPLIPVFKPQSSLSPPKKGLLSHHNVSLPPPQTSLTASLIKPGIPSPRRLRGKRVLPA